MVKDERLLTVQEVAAILHVVPRTVRREIERGNMPAVKIGNAVRIRESALDWYLDSRAVVA